MELGFEALINFPKKNMRGILILACLCSSGFLPLMAQGRKNLNEIAFNPTGPGIQNHRLFDDSLSSSFLIYARDSVSEHLHQAHAEQVFILEGEGQMTMDGKTFAVSAGDIIYIPKGTKHLVRVMSKSPLKLISVQAPYFDGKDRVFRGDY
jgi:mannose-6-phosphate isomerase-like protein (cupin superfamily)